LKEFWGREGRPQRRIVTPLKFPPGRLLEDSKLFTPPTRRPPFCRFPRSLSLIEALEPVPKWRIGLSFLFGWRSVFLDIFLRMKRINKCCEAWFGLPYEAKL